MGFAQESGYTPPTIDTIMTSIMTGINTQFGTSYTMDTFVATNFYKYFYALAQRVQQNEIKTSEIFLKVQQYFETINAQVARPVVTNPGLIDALESAGYIASVKPMIDADAGKINICVNVDSGAPDYATTKAAIAQIIKNSTVAGAVTQGAQSTNITLSNGQQFAFKFHLPTKITPLLKLTITLSENNQVVVGAPDDVKLLLLSNINARYRLGRNFEPQRYFSVLDAPWASAVKLEYSLNGGSSWLTSIYDANFDELFDVKLENITLVEI